MERHILHLDLDTFFVSVERLNNSKLNGLPVIVGGTSDRGVVAACSYEARQYGVHSAMPAKLARQLCPHAIFIRGDYDAYSKYSDIVTEILKEKAPVVEKASIDEHYLDLTGMDKYFGCNKWATELRQKVIKETGLPISFGLSINKTVSKVATGQAKPNGQLQICTGGEKPFLAPLSIKKIPMIGDKTYIQLRNMGISHVRTVQEMEIELMEKVLGENGVSIWRKCNGIDSTPVIPYSERKSISKEETFDKDTINMELLKKTIATMVDELAFDLRKTQILTSCIAVKIRYSDFNTEQAQQKIPYTASTKKLTEKALDLFRKVYSRRILLRLVGVKFSNLVNGTEQIDLFNDVATEINLNRAMDSIRLRFGNDKVMKAISL
jgi:DNA polymerase-4